MRARIISGDAWLATSGRLVTKAADRTRRIFRSGRLLVPMRDIVPAAGIVSWDAVLLLQAKLSGEQESV